MENNWISRYEWILAPLAIFILLTISYVLYPVSGGENQYLAMAKAFMDPTWIPNSFSLSEFPGSRVVFQYVFGFPLEYMEIEQACVVFRILNYLAISFPLYKLIKALHIHAVLGILVLQVFITGQSQLGGEWIIGTFEPKTVAYVFFLWAFVFWEKRQYMLMAFFGALACYFHIIVGGWFFIAVGIISMFRGELKPMFKPALLALVLLIPLLVYLKPLFSGNPIQADPSADHIYCYHRLMNHLGIAKSMDYFIGSHLKGAVISAGLIILSLVFKRRIGANVFMWICVCFSISLVYVGVAFIDSFLLNQQGALGLKFYPFRLNSFGFLLLLLSTGSMVFSPLLTNRTWAVIVFGLAAFGFAIGKGVDSHKRNLRLTEKLSQSPIKWIKRNTNKEAIFLLDIVDVNSDFYQNFIRITGRENFSVYKFVPAEKEKVVEWYRRQMVLKNMRRNPDSASNIATLEGVDYILSDRVLPGLKPETKSESYFIYQLDK